MPASRVILVVDDDALGAESLVMLLRSRGYVGAEWAANGEAALTKIGGIARYDALIIDQYMPGIDGLVVLRKLRERVAWHDVPVLILTAASDDDLDEIEREVGGLRPAAVVRKPADLDVILAELEALMPPRKAADR
jgi:CheY-like chemotaxis protein